MQHNRLTGSIQQYSARLCNLSIAAFKDPRGIEGIENMLVFS